MTNKFTLLAGLRYELTPPFTNTLGNYFTVNIPTIDYSLNQPQSNYPTLVRQGDNCTDPYAGLSLRWTVTPVGCAKDFGMNNNLRETKYKNFAPRLGATYALGDKTVIRSGVGLYYMEDIGNAEYFDMARITAARVDTQASATNAAHLGQCGSRRGDRLGASDVVVGGCLRATRRRAPGSIWSTWSGSLPRTGQWSWATSDRRAAISMGSRPSTRPVQAR